MAITVTERGFDSQVSASADLTIGPFTPAAGSMLVMALAGANDIAVNGITGHDGGSAWVQIVSVPGWSGANRDFKLWACFVGGSPSSATVTVDVNYDALHMAALFELAGVDTSGTVANAFGVNGQEAGYNTSPWTATLAAFASATNMTFAIGIQIDATPTFTWSDGTFTTGTLRQQGTWAMQAAWLNSEDNVVILATENSKHVILWATEIKQAVVAGSFIGQNVSRMAAMIAH